MNKGIQTWLEADNYALKDNEWHMDEYYASIRNKLPTMISRPGGICRRAVSQ